VRGAGLIGLTFAVMACSGQAPAPQVPAEDGAAATADEDAAAGIATAECDAWRSEEPYATPLRGRLAQPDPRAAETLADRGFAADFDGIRRALAADDLTAHLAALTAVSALRCRGLLGEVEGHLASPAPVAAEAAVTLVELGDTAQVTRGRAALRAALADASWPEVQLGAAAYLARAGDGAGLPVLHRALAADEEALRLQAVLAVDAFSEQDEVDAVALYEAVLLGPDPSALVRREAVYRVAALPRSPRRDALLEKVATQDPDPAVQRAAALRLDAVGDPAE
jgi:hypothetical protein